MYQIALRRAEGEINDLRTKVHSLKAEEMVLEERIKMLEDTVHALEPLCADEGGDSNVGLTDACLQVLDYSFVTVPEIKKRLQEIGVQMHSYKNPLAVLHTTLNRMHVSGQVEKVGGGKIDGEFKKTSFRKARG